MAEPAAAILRLMARNNLWANHRLHTACAKLDPADYHKTRASFFGSIHGTLNHILQIDRLYLARLEARRPTAAPYGEELYTELAPLTAAQRELDRQLVAFVDGLAESDLTRRLTWVNRAGEETGNSLPATLLHLFQHQIHHRGQVHDMLSATLVPPPQLDEFFLEEDADHVAEELRALGVD